MRWVEFDTRWTLARCQFTLICGAALIDRELKPDEEQEVLALAARTRTLHDLRSELIQEMFDFVKQANADGSLRRIIQKAIEDLPKDPEIALSIYAHCVDIVLADRKVKQSEVALIDQLAKELKIDPAKRKLIDKVLDWKNEAR